MGIPVVLVTGFLGAGKTSFINRLLAQGSMRIAAVVNDFGAVNIDAELVAGAAAGIVGLANGCICCALQGDLLRTLSLLLRRDPVPEGIVIETSGVAEPGPILASLLDPVVWHETPLESVVGVADAAALAAGERADDPLLRSQLQAADFLWLAKRDLLAPAEAAAAEAALGAMGVRGRGLGEDELGLLFGVAMHAPGAAPRRAGPVAARFESLSWSGGKLSLPRFQATMQALAPRLVRAKGMLALDDREQTLLFQMVGRRATLAPASGTAPGGGAATRLVLIWEIGALQPAEVRRALEACRGAGAPAR
ncbi:MAG: GTP-binding protein [Rhodospirillales bacterium]|nr:GTP-binding protein [Rhodospirillales bacterium]